MASEQGLIGLAFANGGGSKPRVAPFGGMRAMLGTNPLAFTVPVEGRPPLMLDFSTSIVASGKIRIAQNKGEDLPAGWILDREGRPSCVSRRTITRVGCCYRRPVIRAIVWARSWIFLEAC